MQTAVVSTTAALVYYVSHYNILRLRELFLFYGLFSLKNKINLNWFYVKKMFYTISFITKLNLLETFFFGDQLIK